jgi:hypothetical protein
MDNSRNSPDPRYGAWKFIQEISLDDMLANPVWLWCMQLGLPDEEDGPFNGDETSMRPLLQSNEVPLDHIAPPLILLRVSGTNYYASGIYDTEKKILESIGVFTSLFCTEPAYVNDLPELVTYVAVPSIGGQYNVRFQSASRSADEATQLP